MNLILWMRAMTVAARNVLVGTNLMSLRLASRPRRFLGYVNESLFLYRTLSGSHGLPERNVFEVVPGDDLQTIALANLRSGVTEQDEMWLHPIASYATDIVSLCLLCRLVQPKVVFEIGTLRGYTALHLALNAPSDARVHTLDLPKDQPVVRQLPATIVDELHVRGSAAIERYCFDGTSAAAKINCLFGDSATFDYTPFAGRVDLFFIDGAHSYEYVRSDTLHALDCCHTGSVIAWHDFGRMGVNGVSRWLREFATSQQVYVVPGGSLAYMVVE